MGSKPHDTHSNYAARHQLRNTCIGVRNFCSKVSDARAVGSSADYTVRLFLPSLLAKVELHECNTRTSLWFTTHVNL